MKLADVIKLFEKFGFCEEHVKQALSAKHDSAEGYEDLKQALMVRWGEMCISESVSKMRGLRPYYERLMSLKLKSVKRAEAVKAKKTEVEKDKDIVNALLWHKERIRRKQAADFLDAMSEELDRRRMESVIQTVTAKIVDKDEDLPN